MTVIVCGGSWVYRRRVGPCYGLCRINNANLVVSEGSPWYGADTVCVECGDRWCSEGVYPRPFARGWRQASIDEARRNWEDRACSCPVARDEDFYPLPCVHSQPA